MHENNNIKGRREVEYVFVSFLYYMWSVIILCECQLWKVKAVYYLSKATTEIIKQSYR